MKHKIKKRSPRYQRSDIPYSDRLLMQRYDSVAMHRNEAASVALKLACVALNETERLGIYSPDKICQGAQSSDQ